MRTQLIDVSHDEPSEAHPFMLFNEHTGSAVLCDDERLLAAVQRAIRHLSGLDPTTGEPALAPGDYTLVLT